MRLSQYLNGIVNCTIGYINDKDDEISVAAIEIWNTIATEYKERNDQLKKVNLML